MSRIAYVNGSYRNMRDASVHVEDRGYQFSDGVYEVCEIRDGRLVDMPRHMTRLQRSLSELRIAMPMPLQSLSVVMHEVVRRNRVIYGIVYLQITRGVARRDRSHRPEREFHSKHLLGVRIWRGAAGERRHLAKSRHQFQPRRK